MVIAKRLCTASIHLLDHTVSIAVASRSLPVGFLFRSSPVIKLKGNVYFSPSKIVVENTRNCRVDIPGQRSMRAICVNLYVNFTYSSYAEMSQISETVIQTDR